MATEQQPRRSSHSGVAKKDELYLEVRPLCKFDQGETNRRERLAPVFAAVAGDQQPWQTVPEAFRRQGPENVEQCIDCSVAGDVHLARGAFLHEIGGIFLLSGEQQVEQAIDSDAIASSGHGMARL